MILVKLFQSSASFLVPHQLRQVEAIPQRVYNTVEPCPVLEFLGKKLCLKRAADTNHLVTDLL